jgi:hypothetical protein
MKPMKGKVIQYFLSAILTLLLFSYATWGDFSWVTLTGPITLEPNFENMEGPSYIASPALQAIILRLFFLLVCFFFCMIPNLAGGLRKHARYLSGLFAVVYVFFSYILGTLTFFATNIPGASTLRTISIICIGILLCGFYDAAQKSFKVPALLTKATFIFPSLCLFLIVGILNSVFFHGISWFFSERLDFVLLRLGTLLTALTGALAFYARKRGF